MKKSISFLAQIILYGIVLAALSPAGAGVWLVCRHGGLSLWQFLQNEALLKAFQNSLLVCFACIAGQLLIGIPAGWGLARYTFPGKKLLLFLCMLLILLPAQAMLLPQYFILRALGLLNSLWALILPGIFSPLGALIMRQGFLSIPLEQIEAAEALGAGSGTVLLKIALPQRRREVLLLCLVTLAEQWNQLEFPMAYIQSKEKYPLSVYLASGAVLDQAQLLAGSILAVIPLALVFGILLKAWGTRQK